MTEERDIAGFALPFAAGALSASLIPFTATYRPGAAASLSAIALAVFLLSPAFSRMHIFIRRAAVGAAAFFAGAACLCAASAVSPSSLPASSAISQAASSFCESLKDAIASIPFSNPGTPALMTALITGDRSALPLGLTEAFRNSGASHILALSGMHLGIIYSILSAILSRTGNSRQAKAVRSAAVTACCWMYTIGTGAGESITRAFLFILLKEAGGLTHRKVNLKEVTMAALVIQLATDPLAIRSASFQLSYAAMAGIAFIHPHLKGFWPDDGSGPMKKIWESASLSVSCQITTGPLAWLYFRSMPAHFLVTNLIAVPLTVLIIPASLLTIGLSAAGLCPTVLVTATERLTSLLTGALEIIATM